VSGQIHGSTRFQSGKTAPITHWLGGCVNLGELCVVETNIFFISEIESWLSRKQSVTIPLSYPTSSVQYTAIYLLDERYFLFSFLNGKPNIANQGVPYFAGFRICL
jgi:hypothetical protein